MVEHISTETNPGIEMVRRSLTLFDEFRRGKHTIVPFGEGEDNVTYLVDRTWVFRFAKHPDASEKVASEIRLLPHLHTRVAVPVPEVTYAGLQDAGTYFFGYKLIEGEPLTRAYSESISAADQDKILADISGVLKALITFPLALASEAHVKEMNLRLRHEKILGEWKSSPLYTACLDEDRSAIEKAFEQYFNTRENFEFAPSLINTDFSCNHILVDRARTHVSGVIDWSDMAIGDPHYLFPRLWIDLGEGSATDIIHRTLPGANIERVRFFVLARSLRSAVRDARNGKQESAAQHFERARTLAHETAR